MILASEHARYKIISILIWIGLAIGMSTAVLLDQKERSVTPSYRNAVFNWFDGKPLYNMEGSDFIYMPQAALAFAPWGLMPKPLGEVIWRWTILGVFALGVRRLTQSLGGDERWQLANTVVSAMIGAGCVRNGQSTLIITGLMMLAAVDVCQKRWWRSAILLSAAFAFKPLALVLLLLIAGCYFPMLWRLGICFLIVAFAPFLTQNSDYVISQFKDCVENSRVAFEKGETGHWAQLFGMLKVFGFDCPRGTQQIVRFMAAIGTFIACRFVVRNLAPERAAFYLFSLAACYLMLFNSRTEGGTYAMVGPVYGIVLAEEWFRRKRLIPTLLYLLAAIATVFNFDLALLIVKRPNEVWLAPFICLLVTCDLIRRMLGELKARTLTRESGQLSLADPHGKHGY